MKNEKSKFIKIVNWILNILIVILLILGAYLFLERIFGNSPTDFQLISWVVGILFAFTFKIGAIMLKLFTLTYSMNREVGELKIGVKNGFGRIKKDINEINNKLDKIIRK